MAAVGDRVHGEEIDENVLLCGICSERYKNAKILPCQHSFCEQCLTKLDEESGANRAITCPICRRSHQLPDSGVSGIDSNGFLNGLVDLFNNRESSGKCQACKRENQSIRCIECSVDICENCVTAHQLFPMTKTHRLMPVTDYQETKTVDPVAVQPPPYCAEHPNLEIEFYCDSCDKVGCPKCILYDHSTTAHKYRRIKEAVGDYTKDLTSMIDRMKVKEAEASDSKAAVAAVLDSLETFYGKEKEKIKEHTEKTVEKVTCLIRETGDQVLEELKDEYEKRKVNLNAQFKELEIAEGDLSSTREYAETQVSFGNKVHLMSGKTGMTTKVDECLKMQTKSDPTESDYMEFEPCDDFCPMKSLGVIQRNACSLIDVPPYARVGEDIVATIATRQETSTPLVSSVHSVMAAPDGSRQEAEVNDNDDGTLTLTVCAKTAGEHELSVSVRNVPVSGSPVMIKIIPKRGLVCSFKEENAEINHFEDPYGITMVGNREVLVSDVSNENLQSFNLDGNHQKIFQLANVVDAMPRDMARSRDGRVFMTDGENAQVIVCDQNGKVVSCFGKGELRAPIGIAISPVNGRVYVADNKAHLFHIYDQDGNHIKSVGGRRSGRSKIVQPWFLCVDSHGNVYVSDAFYHRIHVFDADGQFLYTFGSRGSGDGQLIYPRGVATDKDGYVYVSDKGNNRIVKYDSEGKFVCRVDSDDDGLSEPWGICVTDDEPFAKVLVVDRGNKDVKVFAQ